MVLEVLLKKLVAFSMILGCLESALQLPGQGAQGFAARRLEEQKLVH